MGEKLPHPTHKMNGFVCNYCGSTKAEALVRVCSDVLNQVNTAYPELMERVRSISGDKQDVKLHNAIQRLMSAWYKGDHVLARRMVKKVMQRIVVLEEHEARYAERLRETTAESNEAYAG
jgi:hypothetical protein